MECIAKTVKERSILQRSPKSFRLQRREERRARAEAVKDKAVFVKMLVRQKPAKFQVDCGARAYLSGVRSSTLKVRTYQPVNCRQ